MSKPRVVVSTFYTPSHARLLDQFVDSLLVTGFPRDDLRVHKFPQECERAEYMSPGWLDTMWRKVRSACDDLASLDTGDILIHADCDIRWYRNPAEIAHRTLGSSPSLWQYDGAVTIAGRTIDAMCAGLGMIRCNALGEMVAYEWLERVERLPAGPYRHDQDVLCDVVQRLQFGAWSRLLPVQWWSHAHPESAMAGAVWTPSMRTPGPPPNIVAHHANWCVGVGHKLELLDRVAKLVAEREGAR